MTGRRIGERKKVRRMAGDRIVSRNAHLLGENPTFSIDISDLRNVGSRHTIIPAWKRVEQ